MVGDRPRLDEGPSCTAWGGRLAPSTMPSLISKPGLRSKPSTLITPSLQQGFQE